MFKKFIVELVLKIAAAGSKKLRNRWAGELRKKGLLVVPFLILCTCCGCSDSFKLWYVNAYDSVAGTQAVPQQQAGQDLQACADMIGAEPRLCHIELGADCAARMQIRVLDFDRTGIRFQTRTFGAGRNDLDKNYETLVLTRFKDGTQKVFGTSWPAADSRAFADDGHDFGDVERFMVVLNRGRVDRDGKIIGKARLVEFSKVVVI